MNNEQQQIIDDAFKNYITHVIAVLKEQYPIPGGWYEKEEFINKCKTDNEFSENWGLKIEERELSLLERREIAKTKLEWNDWVDVVYRLAHYKKTYDKYNIPTKLITVTYNNQTIESYE